MVTVYLATERAHARNQVIDVALRSHYDYPRVVICEAVGNASSCTATFCNSDSTYPLLSIIAPCASRDHQCFLQQANGKWALLKRIFVSRIYHLLSSSPPFSIRLPSFTPPPFDQGRLIILLRCEIDIFASRENVCQRFYRFYGFRETIIPFLSLSPLEEAALLSRVIHRVQTRSEKTNFGIARRIGECFAIACTIVQLSAIKFQL